MARVTQVKEERPVRVLELMSASIGSHGFDVLRVIHLKNRTTGDRVAKARVRAARVRGLGLRFAWFCRARRQSEKWDEVVAMKRACVEKRISKEG